MSRAGKWTFDVPRNRTTSPNRAGKPASDSRLRGRVQSRHRLAKPRHLRGRTEVLWAHATRVPGTTSIRSYGTWTLIKKEPNLFTNATTVQKQYPQPLGIRLRTILFEFSDTCKKDTVAVEKVFDTEKSVVVLARSYRPLYVSTTSYSVRTPPRCRLSQA